MFSGEGTDVHENQCWYLREKNSKGNLLRLRCEFTSCRELHLLVSLIEIELRSWAASMSAELYYSRDTVISVGTL